MTARPAACTRDGSPACAASHAGHKPQAKSSGANGSRLVFPRKRLVLGLPERRRPELLLGSRRATRPRAALRLAASADTPRAAASSRRATTLPRDAPSAQRVTTRPRTAPRSRRAMTTPRAAPLLAAGDDARELRQGMTPRELRQASGERRRCPASAPHSRRTTRPELLLDSASNAAPNCSSFRAVRQAGQTVTLSRNAAHGSQVAWI
jgi:hypothetical protein